MYLTQVIFLLVLQPCKPGLEVLVTERAFEGPVLGVQDHVLLQVRPAAKCLRTNLLGRVQVVKILNFMQGKIQLRSAVLIQIGVCRHLNDLENLQIYF